MSLHATVAPAGWNRRAHRQSLLHPAFSVPSPDCGPSNWPIRRLLKLAMRAHMVSATVQGYEVRRISSARWRGHLSTCSPAPCPQGLRGCFRGQDRAGRTAHLCHYCAETEADGDAVLQSTFEVKKRQGQFCHERKGVAASGRIRIFCHRQQNTGGETHDQQAKTGSEGSHIPRQHGDSDDQSSATIPESRWRSIAIRTIPPAHRPEPPRGRLGGSPCHRETTSGQATRVQQSCPPAGVVRQKAE